MCGEGRLTASLRLLADDLTGALDSAARFVPVTGPVATMWHDTDLPEAAAIDSGTRDMPEAAACMRWFDHCVLAPAFPFQGRITRGGRQLVRSDAGWRDTGVDLAAALG